MTKASNNLSYADTLRALYAGEAAFCRVLPAFISSHVTNAAAGFSAETIRTLKEHLIDSRWQKQLLKACLEMIGEAVPETSYAAPAPDILRDLDDLIGLKRSEVSTYLTLLPQLKAEAAPPEIINACEEILEQEAAMLEGLRALGTESPAQPRPAVPFGAGISYHA